MSAWIFFFAVLYSQWGLFYLYSPILEIEHQEALHEITFIYSIYMYLGGWQDYRYWWLQIVAFKTQCLAHTQCWKKSFLLWQYVVFSRFFTAMPTWCRVHTTWAKQQASIYIISSWACVLYSFNIVRAPSHISPPKYIPMCSLQYAEANVS